MTDMAVIYDLAAQPVHRDVRLTTDVARLLLAPMCPCGGTTAGAGQPKCLVELGKNPPFIEDESEDNDEGSGDLLRLVALADTGLCFPQSLFGLFRRRL